MRTRGKPTPRSHGTRRQFLINCSALAFLTAGAPGLLAETISPGARRRSLNEISCQDFARHLGSNFRIHTASGKSVLVTLRRLAVKNDRPLIPGRPLPPDAGNETFSLLFSGRRKDLLTQETYTFEHDVLGQFDCFIVPVLTMDQRRINYEMVCNRPRRV